VCVSCICVREQESEKAMTLARMAVCQSASGGQWLGKSERERQRETRSERARKRETMVIRMSACMYGSERAREREINFERMVWYVCQHVCVGVREQENKKPITLWSGYDQ